MSKYLKIGALIFVDQIIKFIVRTFMAVGQTIPIIPGIFHITRVQNRGVAWGSFEGMTLLTVVLPIILIGVIIFFMEKKKENITPFLSWALVIVVGGGLSNQIDRIFLGSVTDMIDFRVWPVFNLADMAVVCGCIMVIIYVLFLDKKGKSKKES